MRDRKKNNAQLVEVHNVCGLFRYFSDKTHQVDNENFRTFLFGMYNFFLFRVCKNLFGRLNWKKKSNQNIPTEILILRF